MSLPIQYAQEVSGLMRSKIVRNFIAQSKAKQVLREVHELPDNFPSFTDNLDERVTFIAYRLLAAGCSLIEQGEAMDGYADLQAAADLLESAHRTEAKNDLASGFNCLVGAMSFYACGQYSRAFVLIRDVEAITPAAGVIASFLKKDSYQTIVRLNEILLAPTPEQDDSDKFNEWALTVILARSISLMFEHAYSGDMKLLEKADAFLKDALIISETSLNPAFWWLARLLRLMLIDYGKGSLWNVLPRFFGPNGTDQIADYVRLLALTKPPVTELWQSQIASLELALNSENRGAVINLRTSAGKTRVAELAMLQVLKADPNAKVIYLAPFRSLAFELERTFNKSLFPLGFSISHLYGGSRFSGVDRELVAEAHITIATPEKAKAMLRAAPELFDAVKLIVVDEGHLLGGNERNVRNELFLEHLRLLARQRGARILLLSAVLPNADELASWVGGNPEAVIKSNWKPSSERFGLLRWSKSGVKIEWKGEVPCFNPRFVEFKDVIEDGKKRRFPRTKAQAVAATAVRLAELGPVLIFAGQAQWVASMTKGVLQALGPGAPVHKWPETEWKIFEAVCSEELGDGSLELQAARVGVICHCNKLPPQVRIAIEKLMSKYPPRIIVATTTLGQGVNIGISSVIVSTTSIGKKSNISKRDFWNICGRAGRAFVDSEGKVLFAIDGTREPVQIKNDEKRAEDYFDIAHLDKIKSGLLLVVRILHDLAREARVSFDVLLEMVANNNFERCGEKKKNVEWLLDMVDDQLLALHLSYKGIDDISVHADWVDDAFRESLAAIQEAILIEKGQEPYLISFLKARTIGVLNKVPSSAARSAIVASGLPLSVGVVAFSQLDIFREIVDRFLDAESNEAALNSIVKEFESWARENATAIIEKMPNQELLDNIRPFWLGGVSLHDIVEIHGKECTDICTQLYGYNLPWLFHSIAQKLDKNTEDNRIAALSTVGLLVELGLPTEAAAKVFLAGVRSRKAAVELSTFVTNPSASVSRIRKAFLNPSLVAKLAKVVSPSTIEWLRLLATDHGAAEVDSPQCAPFRLDVPKEVEVIHARRVDTRNITYLCSTDARFKCAIKTTEELPFDDLANDPRYIFVRDGNLWYQQCRDPHVG